MKNIHNEITILRKEIDQIDDNLLDLLSKRAKAVRRIGELKHENKIKRLDKKRRLQVIKSNTTKAGSLDLSSIFVRKIFNLIHDYSLSLQKEK